MYLARYISNSSIVKETKFGLLLIGNCTMIPNALIRNLPEGSSRNFFFRSTTSFVNHPAGSSVKSVLFRRDHKILTYFEV